MSSKTKVTCIFCRCLITVKDGDKARFNDHMNNEHDVRYDFDTLLVISVMTDAEKKNLQKDFASKVNDRIKQTKKVPSLELKEDEDVNVNNFDFTNNDEKIEISDDEDSQTVKEKIEISDDEANEESHENIPEDVSDKTQLSPAPAPPPKKVEGVLKCKICSKYIKQSLMENHKKTAHKDDTNSTNNSETEKLLAEPGDFDKLIKTMKENRSQQQQKRKHEDEEEDGDDDTEDKNDKDWSMSAELSSSKKRTTRLPCRYCKKRFGSNLTLTKHERTVHKQ